MFFILNELYNVDCDFSVAEWWTGTEKERRHCLGTTESREEA